MIPFQMPEKAIIEKATDHHGTFFFKPLERGFGVTIGNALRRILLSSLEGYAITSIRFPNVLHEFSTIKGVYEDITNVILNLKEVRFRRKSQGGEDSETIKVTIEEIFRAGDIARFTPSFEILNPNHVICHIDASTPLELFLTIRKGRGYVSAEENKEDFDEQDYGLIPIDAIFTPIKNVEYYIENTRVDQRTDYEQLCIKVDTDGSVHPKEALQEAAGILIKHFCLFSDRGMEFDSINSRSAPVMDEKLLRMRKLLKTPLEDLELSVRAYNCLHTAGVKTLLDIVRLQVPEMMRFRNFGRKSLAELEQLIEENGLQFGMDTSAYKIEESA